MLYMFFICDINVAGKLLKLIANNENWNYKDLLKYLN